MKEYDAIVVFGAGIEVDGSNFESVEANVRKAVHLYNQGVATRVIFSGMWSYRINETPPPWTEAKAMADYALRLGLPEEAVLLEDQSDTTVANAYQLKKHFLEPNNWRDVLLVVLPIIYKRAFFTLTKILGPDYHCDYVLSDYTFPEDQVKKRHIFEEEKLKILQEETKDIPDGDEEAVYLKERRYLTEKGLI